VLRLKKNLTTGWSRRLEAGALKDSHFYEGYQFFSGLGFEPIAAQPKRYVLKGGKNL